MNKQDIAKKISELHIKSDFDIELIWFYKSSNEIDDDEPIKLLEINSSSVSSGIVPVNIMPSAEIPLSSIIIEITPKEYNLILDGNLKLPNKWIIAEKLYEKDYKTEDK